MTAPHVVDASNRYRSTVLTAWDRGGWGPELERTALDAVRRLNQARRISMRPEVARAAWTATRTILFAVVPLLAADALLGAGWWPVAIPLVLVAGMACYGGIAIVHDLAHGSFLPSRRLNIVIGRILGPMLLLDYDSFRHSHLGHHQHSQSMADPKRFGVEKHARSADPDHRQIDVLPAFVRAPLRLGAALVRLPLRVRQILYLVVSPIFVAPAVLLIGAEFSLANRDLRRPATILASLESIAYIAALYAWSPQLLVLFFIALMIAYAFTFQVFATHITPNQANYSWERRAELADALNVSDVHCGRLVRWFGLGLSNYHSTHHLAPAIPCYHLHSAEAMVASDLEPLRAPAIDLLDPASCALLYDALLLSAVNTSEESWDVAGGAGLRRPVTQESIH